MDYRNEEIHIRDVNLFNAKVYVEGWVYITTPHIQAPQYPTVPRYFAPYFTNQNRNPGLSLISRVEAAKVIIPAGVSDKDLPDALSEEHRKHWRIGLAMLLRRAEKEGFSDKGIQVLFLDKPKAFTAKPLTKNGFNSTRPRRRIPPQIYPGFSLRFYEIERAMARLDNRR